MPFNMAGLPPRVHVRFASRAAAGTRRVAARSCHAPGPRPGDLRPIRPWPGTGRLVRALSARATQSSGGSVGVAERRNLTDAAMRNDLAALTPPLVMAVAFIAGVVVLLRREMAPRRRGRISLLRSPTCRATHMVR